MSLDCVRGIEPIIALPWSLSWHSREVSILYLPMTRGTSSYRSTRLYVLVCGLVCCRGSYFTFIPDYPFLGVGSEFAGEVSCEVRCEVCSSLGSGVASGLMEHLSLPFLLLDASSSSRTPVSPCQNSSALRRSHMSEYPQCLLSMSDGLIDPGIWNMDTALDAIASLT